MIEIQEILFDERTVQTKVGDLAAQIASDYAGKDLVLICILKGGVVFMADLIRRIPFPVTIDFISASSYGMSTTAAREIRIKKDIEIDVRGRHVLLVDTIIDTGETLACLFKRLSEKGPASLEAAVLLDKKPRRTAEVRLKYRGFEIPDRFVVGYGIDCAEQYRNLPYVAVIKTDT
jgi:hypoxanthine phosphoribosyltransferase